MCNGKINQQGICDKCYQPALTTSNQCFRLIPLEQVGIRNNEVAQKLAFEYMQKQFVDYGDLNVQAENQIMQAFYNGYLAALDIMKS